MDADVQDDPGDLIRRNLFGGDEEREMAAFGALSPQRRVRVLDRLRAIDGYERAGRTMAAAADCAASVGMSTGGFLNLRTRAVKHGPVTGMAPYQRRQQRPSASRDGLPAIAENVIRRMLAADPAARTSAIVAAVEDRMARSGRGAIPTTTVQRRIEAVRGRRPRFLAVGRRVSVVQLRCRTELLGDEWLTIVYDEDWSIVFGNANDADPEASLEQALTSAVAGIGDLAAAGVPISARVERVAVRVAPAMSEWVGRWEREAGRMRPDVEFRGEYGSGAASVPVLGSVAVGGVVGLDPFALRRLVREWNAGLLDRAHPRARTGVDDGSALRTALDTLRLRFGSGSATQAVPA
ncbi:MAG: hypothetical protein J0J06_03755 [Sphingomonas sp.]|uniref:hypothetical protein n=1 Tax=Sphingomonas sp. TaxID=28214 RepID=UPI001AD20D25|nr:hypothetical protein [Sphingomonas sp.]MBN8814547.1 hypothetical protein [Sphingomonas sp.]